MRPGLAIGAIALLILSFSSPRATADTPTIYKWVDRNGIAHYTTDPKQIPSNLRNRIGEPRRPDEAPPPEPEPTSANAPAATAASGSAATAASAPGPMAARVPTPGAAEDEEILDDRPAVHAGESEPAPEIPSVEAGTALGSPGPDDGGEGGEVATLNTRIAALEAAVARDEEILKALISEGPSGAGDLALADDAEFRELAKRFPKLQADLAALHGQRAQLEVEEP